MENTENTQQKEDIVLGTYVEAADEKGIDYDKLVDKFGCSRMNPQLLE